MKAAWLVVGHLPGSHEARSILIRLFEQTQRHRERAERERQRDLYIYVPDTFLYDLVKESYIATRILF